MVGLALLLETVIITALSMATGAAYHLFMYGEAGPLSQFLGLGLLVAALFEMPLVVHAHYRTEHEHAGRRNVMQLVNSWTYAFLCVALIALVTKTGGNISRGWLVLFFAAGLAAVVGFEWAMRRGLDIASSYGLSVAARRLAIIGTREEIERFRKDHIASNSDNEIVAAKALPEGGWRAAKDDGSNDIKSFSLWLDPLMDTVRQHGVTDIVILCEWAHGTEAMGIAEQFLDMPVAVHLGRIGVVENFPQMRVAKLGHARTLVLRNEPLSTTQMLAKRVFDLIASAVALLLLLPVFLTVAALIKLDSQGPVFFLQRRRGFNLQEFRIWKFRTMTTMDDGDEIQQATSDDARVTRLGRLLRRFNIDELPQLINVLLGDMSLVGPRPHAVAHDRHYERVIARYARRLNVKPGITGWAQINGFRGATDDSAMQDRVTHDLHYIENWSIALDVYIVLMTVLSPRAYRNAH